MRTVWGAPSSRRGPQPTGNMGPGGGPIAWGPQNFMTPAMSLGLRFCVSRKGGTGGGGWVHPKGANSMAASGLVFRSDLVGTGRAISILFGINGVRNQRSHLVGPPFPEFKARFSATAGWHFLRDLTRRLIIGGCGQSHVSAKYG